MIPDSQPNTGHILADTGAILLMLASLVGYLPSVAALISIIWMAIRVYETCTVQRWLHKSQCKIGGKHDE